MCYNIFNMDRLCAPMSSANEPPLEIGTATQPWENPSALEQAVYNTAHDAARRLFEISGLKDSITQLKQNNEILSEQAGVDPLTGLNNRRSIEKAFSGLQESHHPDDRRDGSANSESATFLLVLDLDGFKNVNDTQGHNAGDELLRDVANIMNDNVRPRDPVARWGGDEFVMLLPRISRERADEIANTIRVAVQEKTATTASIGVGCVDYDKNLCVNVNTADRALLAAKRGGKNIVAHFDQLGVEA